MKVRKNSSYTKWKPFFRSAASCFFLMIFICGLVSAEGWKRPVSYSDPEGKWKNEWKSYDANSSSYAEDWSIRSGWGAFVVLNLSGDTLSSRLRVNADWWTGAVDKVDIDIYTDGAWVGVHNGAVANCAWHEIEYDQTVVSKIRMRYHYKNNGYIFWLY